ncbi:MAG: metal-sulfur cluster assembly factor [Candidatus Tectomicrobia bacterium]|uniref:Metal-sulfur cluster assembly factor n=1 Tax=Tectimicrobiota bacterium TaxID=2528274 RepID=A0A932G116_UNCTE|nr:metal-sulfur cluster assembly factor [Candidatus Tectomicrobia bacterium]
MDDSHDPAVAIKEERASIRRALIGNALYDVEDPEMGVNIVDLGLIYDIRVDEENRVEIDLTLTTLGCPMGPQIIADIQDTLGIYAEIQAVKVNLVWSPPWSPAMMSEEARDELLG